jgi:hypothetical protein
MKSFADNKTCSVAPGQSCVVLPLPLTPFAYYRVRFESRSDGPAYWYADFYDSAGVKNYADNNSAVFPSTDWLPHESIFFARPDAVRGEIGFIALKTDLTVRNVSVAEISRDEARDGWQSLLQTLPPLEVQPPPLPWDRLKDLRRRLTEAGEIRWVALGDSLSNDLLNGQGHLWIEDMCPGLRLRIIHANGPEKFANKYNNEAVLQRLVYRHRPEVLMVGGLSHMGQEDAVREIIARTRAACGDLDALFVNVDGGFTQDQEPGKKADYLARLADYGASDRFAVMDLSAPWADYVRRSGRSHASFMRDHQHVNDGGKAILGRLFAAHFGAVSTK